MDAKHNDNLEHRVIGEMSMSSAPDNNENKKSETPGEGDRNDFDLASFFPYLVRIYYRSVSSSVSAVYETRYGMSSSEWRTMAVLGPHGVMSAGEIVAASSMDKVNVSRAISKMRERGYLKRDIDGDDRRRSVVRLTTDGRNVFYDLLPRVRKLEEHLMQGLSKADRQTLQDLMQKVRNNAESMPEL